METGVFKESYINTRPLYLEREQSLLEACRRPLAVVATEETDRIGHPDPVDDRAVPGSGLFFDMLTGRNLPQRDLELAARHGNINVVRGFLDDGLQICSHPAYDPLNKAIIEARADVFDLLVERGAASHEDLVIRAAPKSKNRRCRMARRILSSGVRVEFKPGAHWPQWRKYAMAALAFDDFQLVDFLLQPNVTEIFHLDQETIERLLA